LERGRDYISISVEQLQKSDNPNIAAFLAEKQNIAFAAKLDGKEAGLLYGYILTRMDGKRPQFFIYAVDIYPDYQGKGYGGLFVRHVVEWAQQQGFGETFTITEKSNIAACKAYEKAGMVYSEEDDDRMYVIEYTPASLFADK